MQHDNVLKKLNFDLLTLGGGGGSAGKIIAAMLIYFVIPFYLICNMTRFWKSGILTHRPNPQGRVGVVCRQNIWYHVAAIVIPINLTCNMTKF